jgi:hypothetical protein
MTTAMEGVKRHRWWTRLAVAGFGCGVAAGAWLDWYFSAGPGAAGLDAGEAHGFWLMLVGFPVIFLIGPVASAFPPVMVRALVVLSVGLSWALPWLLLYVVQRLDELG